MNRASEDVLQEVTTSASCLISAKQLEALLGEPTVKLFDVRGTWKNPPRALPADYGNSHIPGARFLDWTQHFIDTEVNIGQASVADRSSAAEAFAALGINHGDLVVLYDDYSHMLAGRMWLAMRHWGAANVRVLNGGWSHWVSQSLPVSTDTPATERGSFEPQMQQGLKVDLDDFLAIHEQSCVIDGRGAQGYAGNTDDPRTGHIPGSLNIPFSSMLNPETGLFLDPEAMAHTFDAATPRWRKESIIATCGSGYAATVILLALKELGRPATLFDGSFAIWKQDPNRPVEQSSTD